MPTTKAKKTRAIKCWLCGVRAPDLRKPRAERRILMDWLHTCGKCPEHRYLFEPDPLLADLRWKEVKRKPYRVRLKTKLPK